MFHANSLWCQFRDSEVVSKTSGRWLEASKSSKSYRRQDFGNVVFRRRGKVDYYRFWKTKNHKNRKTKKKCKKKPEILFCLFFLLNTIVLPLDNDKLSVFRSADDVATLWHIGVTTHQRIEATGLFLPNKLGQEKDLSQSLCIAMGYRRKMEG